MMNDINKLYYLAGIFDGEGCVSIVRRERNKYTLSCSVGTAGDFLPNLFLMHFGGWVNKRHHKNPNWKDYYAWSATGQKALYFLNIITPYLLLKKPQAELGIEFQKRRYQGRRGNPSLFAQEESELLLMKVLKEESYT